MNQDEARLIYDYLHENYTYREDGNLVRTYTPKYLTSVKKGDVLGSFFYQGDSPRMRCTLTINKRDYTKNLSHLIFLYHNKRLPKVIEYYDGNPTNCRIENLKETDRVETEAKKTVRGWKHYVSSTGKTRYRVTLQMGNELKVHFGSCETPEEARAVYDLAKKTYVEERLDPLIIKKRVMEAFPHLKMKLKKENESGYPGVYKRGKRFVARHRIDDKTVTSTHDTAEEAHQVYLSMVSGDFKSTNRVKLSDTCTIEGCKEEWYCKNLCKKHYFRYISSKKRYDKANKTGFPGVKLDKGKYSARYKNIHLGTFLTPEAAHDAYLVAKKKDLIFL